MICESELQKAWSCNASTENGSSVTAPNTPEREKTVKNKLLDLNNHLFEQLERLNDEDLKGDALQEEIERSKSVTAVAGKIVDNAKLALEAEKLKIEYGTNGRAFPKMLES